MLVSVCCPPQNEHIDIKKLQVVMLELFLKKHRKCQKIHHFLFFFIIFFATHFFLQAVSQEPLQTSAQLIHR